MTSGEWVQLGLAAVTAWMAVSTWMMAKREGVPNDETRRPL